MKTASAINYLKNVQILLRGVIGGPEIDRAGAIRCIQRCISDIDKIQVSLTELPPPKLGPSPGKTNGARHLKRRIWTNSRTGEKIIEN